MMIRHSLLLLILVFSCPLNAQSLKPTIAKTHINPVEKNELRFNLSQGFRLGIALHQNFISHVDGDRCRMRPSCSAYSLQALQKHGVYAGLVLTSDRLLHELDEWQVSPILINKDNSVYVSDPVENNDFWWNKKKEK